ncbi:MAG: HEAT repeat domain-containing protein [Planctomycetaceae bacterium]|nr:HEAT repeat domain-containing protein [Planctomycetaceae bacterium]
MQILCGAGLESSIDFSPLVEAITHKDPAVRQWAREQFIAVGRPAVDVLRDLLHDHRPHVRWEAAKSLAAIADPRTANALVEVLAEDDEFDVRWLAGEGLIALGYEGLWPLLTALAAHPGSPNLQEGARHVCHHLSKRRAFRFLAPVLQALRLSEPALSIPAVARAALANLRALTFPRRVRTLGGAEFETSPPGTP